MKRLHLSLCVRAELLFVLLFSLMAIAPALAQDQDQAKTPVDKLLQAVQDSNPKVVKALLDQGVSPNAPNSQKTPPLTALLGAGDDTSLEIARLLVSHGADVNATNTVGDTPLTNIVAEEDAGSETSEANLVAFLLDHGADPMKKGFAGTVLDVAMQPGHQPVVHLLYARHISLSPDNSGKETPLHYAAYAADPTGIQAALKSGLSVCAEDSFGRTPLSLAVEAHSLECVSLLLNAGYNPNLSADADEASLVTAINNGDLNIAFALLQGGASVNGTTVPGDPRAPETPLIAALGQDTQEGSHSNAETRTLAMREDQLTGEILDHGADVNQESGGYTPLEVAVMRGPLRQSDDTDWVKALLDRGARVNDPEEGRDPILFVTLNGQTKDLAHQTLLVSHGADINAISQEKVPLLCQAIQDNDISFAMLLISRGAKVNIYDPAHKSPLLWAAYQGSLGLVKMLIAHGADLQVKDTLGQNAVALAIKGKHPEVAAYLKRHGAAVSPGPAHGTRNDLGQHIVLLRFHWPNGLPAPHGALSITVRPPVAKDQPSRYVVKQGNKIIPPILFASLLMNRTLWPTQDYNERAYFYSRGGYVPTAYQIHGLVVLNNTLYVCVAWYLPTESFESQADVMVLKVEFIRQGARVTILGNDDPTDTLPDSITPSRASYLPLIENIDGKLILGNPVNRYQYLPRTGKWMRLGKTPAKLQGDNAPARIAWEPAGVTP